MSDDNLTSVYKCSDGRDFPVRWQSSEHAKRDWYWDPEHNPTPVPPLDAYVWTNISSGTGRACTEVGFAPSSAFIGGDSSIFINGFNYFGPREPTPDEAAKAAVANEALRRRYGSIGPFWEQWCLPRSIRGVEELREAPVDAPIAGLLDTFGYAYEQTFLMWGMENEPLRDFLTTEVGPEGNRIAVELTRGYPTATLEADQALWELAQQAQAWPRVRAALLADPLPSLPEIEEVPDGPAFIEALAGYMDYYGWRTINWEVSGPMVRERPQATLQVLRRTIAEALEAPAARVAAAAAARDAMILEMETQFAADHAKLDEFRARFLRHAAYLTVKEGRALWQLSLNGALRHALLVKGRRLAQDGVIGEAQDVFYLLPDEIEPAVAGTPAAALRDRVVARRAEQQSWWGVSPPAHIGGEGKAPTEAAAEAAVPAAGPDELKGTGASKGTYTGIARVLASFDQYDRLAPGEVLVCATTTPAWTPLFAVAGAVVADGGGMLSHAGVAAREYGIPAVVGARDASRRIPDGATITVDGAGGIVIILR